MISSAPTRLYPPSWPNICLSFIISRLVLVLLAYRATGLVSPTSSVYTFRNSQVLTNTALVVQHRSTQQQQYEQRWQERRLLLLHSTTSRRVSVTIIQAIPSAEHERSVHDTAHDSTLGVQHSVLEATLVPSLSGAVIKQNPSDFVVVELPGHVGSKFTPANASEPLPNTISKPIVRKVRKWHHMREFSCLVFYGQVVCIEKASGAPILRHVLELM